MKQEKKAKAKLSRESIADLLDDCQQTCERKIKAENIGRFLLRNHLEITFS